MPHPNDTLVATLPKNAREEIRVALTEFEGRRLVDVRIYYRGEDGLMHPTPKGLSLDRAKVGELADAIRAAQTRALEAAA